jgi:adenylate cyclase
MLFSDGTSIYPGLAIEALRVAQGQKGIIVRGTGSSGDSDTGHAALIDMRVGAFKLPLTSNGESWIYFSRNRPERYVSVKDVLDPAKEAEVKPRLDGAIVLVGASAAGLMDSRATPLGGLVPGVEIQAQLIEQIIAQDFIERPDWTNGLEIVLTVLFGALVAGLVLAFGARFSFYAGGVVFVGAVAGSSIAFSHFRLLIDPIFPSLAALATYIAVERVLHVASDHEKKFVRQAFGQYLAPELLAQLENSPQAMRLGGESREISVMFMDVRGFTPISETLTATELVDFINMLLSPLSDAIQDELGTIDKYIGDSIMAFWGAPLDQEDRAERAARAAVAIAKKLHADNARRARKGLKPIRIRMGIHQGPALVGNIGAPGRINYTLVGDTVNIAQRLEQFGREVDDGSFDAVIVISAELAAHLPDGMVTLDLGEHELPGRSSAEHLYQIKPE